MALIVQKYGGTSVGNPERIKNVAKRVAKFHAQGHQVVVVVSAMSGETNKLIALAKEVQASPNPRELDQICATGEQVTIGLLSMALMDIGVPARSYTGGQVKVLTDSTFTKARILSIDEANMRADLEAGKVVVVAGFQGITGHGDITTLGRGASDTTAVALAAALFFEAINGFHDTSNAVAMTIYCRALSPMTAVALSAAGNFAGILAGGLGVAFAILHILPVDLLLATDLLQSLILIGAILLGAIFWNFTSWWFGIPLSSTHSLVGAMLGVGAAHGWLVNGNWLEGVRWSEAGTIGLSLLVSPLLGLGLAVAGLRLWLALGVSDLAHQWIALTAGAIGLILDELLRVRRS